MLHFIIHTATTTFVFAFSWLAVVQLVIQVVLPMLVAIVTKETTPGRTRGLLLALFTVILTVLQGVASALTGNTVDFFGLIVTATLGFLIAVGFQFGLWGAKGPDGDSISTKLIKNVGNK